MERIFYLLRIPWIAAYTTFATISLILPCEAATIQFIIVVIRWWVEAIPVHNGYVNLIFISLKDHLNWKCTHLHIDALEGGSISRPWPLDSLYLDVHSIKPIISFVSKSMMSCNNYKKIVLVMSRYGRLIMLFDMVIS